MTMRLGLIMAASMAIGAGAASAQTYTQHFDNTSLGGPRIYGSAVVNNGSLQLTPFEFGRSGSMIIGAGNVAAFTATFDYFFDSGFNFTADGLSFTLGHVPDGPFPGAAELGSGNGITVNLDIFDFNNDGIVGDLGIRVLFNGQVIAEAPDAITGGDAGAFHPVLIRLHDTNQLDVQYNGNNVFTNLDIADFMPDPTYRFALAARTGGERSEQRVDNLSIDANAFSADDCAHAHEIHGDGVYWFDNTNANTDGASDNLCANAGDDQVHGDIWYCWTAPDTGLATLSTVGLSTHDTKLAVYQDCVPCTTARGIIACNDDSQNTLQSTVSFSAVAGTRYLVRVGNFSSSPRGRGAISFSTAPDCNADFNGDHVVNSQDFFDFLTAFFAGC